MNLQLFLSDEKVKELVNRRMTKIIKRRLNFISNSGKFEKAVAGDFLVVKVLQLLESVGFIVNKGYVS